MQIYYEQNIKKTMQINLSYNYTSTIVWIYSNYNLILILLNF